MRTTSPCVPSRTNRFSYYEYKTLKSVQEKNKTIPFLDLLCTLDKVTLMKAMVAENKTDCSLLVEDTWFKDQFGLNNTVSIHH